MKKPVGLKTLTNIDSGQSVEDWFASFKQAATTVFKDAKNVSITKHCPHLDRTVTLKSDSTTFECEECVKDMAHGHKTDGSD